jgi:predicted RNA-binding Zn-ribbon protein involved in translation (DUF1610 family)
MNDEYDQEGRSRLPGPWVVIAEWSYPCPYCGEPMIVCPEVEACDHCGYLVVYSSGRSRET